MKTNRVPGTKATRLASYDGRSTDLRHGRSLHFLFDGANYEISKRDICGGREIGETGKHRGGEYKIFELSSFLLKGFSERELDVRKLRTDTFGLRLVLATRSMRHKQMRKLKTMAITRFLQQCTFVRR